jgi:hypothetical protein
MRYLRNTRRLAGLGALVAIVSLTLWVVLPALAASSSSPPPASLPQSVYPSSPSNGLSSTADSSGNNKTYVTPVDLPVGGNGNCTPGSGTDVLPTVSALPGMRQYQNNNPQTSSSLQSGNSDSATFSLTLGGTSKTQALLLTSTNAAIYGIGLNGGNDYTAYDYTGLDYAGNQGHVTQGWVTADGNLHGPISKTTGSGAPSQWYSMSHLTVCYRPLTTVSGYVLSDPSGIGNAQPGSAPGISTTVTLTDTDTHWSIQVPTDPTTGKYTFTTGAGGNYTVCITAPSNYQQTLPTPTSTFPPGTSFFTQCSGYTIAGLGSNLPPLNFDLQPYVTFSGKIYNDQNLSGSYDPTSGVQPVDSLQNGWTIALYDITQGKVVAHGSSPTPSSAPSASCLTGDGSYCFLAPVIQGDSYKLCEIPLSNGGTWVQTEPAPTSSSPTCDDPSSPVTLGGIQALHWGYDGFTASGGAVSQNFGIAQGSACSNTTVMGNGTNVESLSPNSSSGDGCLKENQTFAFATGTNTSNTQYVGIAAGDPTQTSEFVPMVEKITFRDDFDPSTNAPTYNGLDYFAGTVGSASNMVPVQPCTVSVAHLLDPTNTTNYGGTANGLTSDLWLNTSYVTTYTAETGGASGSSPVLPDGQTACLIKIDISGASDGSGSATGTLTAYVYSIADSGFTPR